MYRPDLANSWNKESKNDDPALYSILVSGCDRAGAVIDWKDGKPIVKSWSFRKQKEAKK
jgi:hypothetical protein